MKNVNKISKAKFKVATPHVLDSELLLDFNPVIEKFKLTGDYYLIHWQARPKGYREWGVYDSANDTYTSIVKPAKSYGSVEYLMLDDRWAKSIPSAVVLFKGLLKL